MGALLRWCGYLLLALVLIYGVLFAIQNTAAVPLDLLIIKLPERSLALWVLLAFAVGGILGLVLGSLALLGLKRQVARLRRQLDKANRELDKLRSSDLRPALTNGGDQGQPKG